MLREKKARKTMDVAFNATPMIDIIFNLIIFFMLVSQFSQLSVEEVELPAARMAEKKEAVKENAIVINIVNPDKPYIKIFGEEFTYDELTAFLAKRKKAVGKGTRLTVILRADEKIQYREIATVMVATAQAGIKSWWVTTEIEKDKPNGL